MKGLYSLGLYEKAMPEGMTFENMLENTKKCGFDCLEISIDETDDRLSRLDWPDGKRANLREAIHSSGVPVKTMCLSGHRRFPLGSHDRAIRKRSLEIMEKAINFSHDIGVRVIQLAGYDVYYEDSDNFTREAFIENLFKCNELASNAGIILAFETMETSFMDTVEKAMDYVKLIGSPYLGVYPDIGNLKNASVRYGTDLLSDIKKGEGHIFAAHLKETAPGIYRNRSFGDGHTEYIPCIKLLYSMGIRMFTGEFWYLGEENFISTLEKASKFLRDKIDAAVMQSGIII